HTGNQHVNPLTDIIAAAFDDDHRPVVQIGDPLSVLFPVFNHLNIDLFTGKDHRFDRISQIIDIENLYPLEFTNLVQVEVVGDDLPRQHLGQFHQFTIHFGNFLKVSLIDENAHIE